LTAFWLKFGNSDGKGFMVLSTYGTGGTFTGDAFLKRMFACLLTSSDVNGFVFGTVNSLPPMVIFSVSSLPWEGFDPLIGWVGGKPRSDTAPVGCFTLGVGSFFFRPFEIRDISQGTYPILPD